MGIAVRFIGLIGLLSIAPVVSAQFRPTVSVEVSLPNANAFGTVNTSADNAVPGTAGHVDETVLALSNFDSCAAGDNFIVMLERASPSGTDATGDAELVGFRLTYSE